LVGVTIGAINGFHLVEVHVGIAVNSTAINKGFNLISCSLSGLGNGYEVLGCFNDGIPRDLPHFKLWNYKDMTLQKCAESCGSFVSLLPFYDVCMSIA
jgi:hypothetical protein